MLSKYPLTSRRQFLETTSATIAAVMAGTVGWAAELQKRWAVAVRDAHLKATGQANCWQALKDLGVGGLEVGVNENLLCPGLFHPDGQYGIGSPDAMDRLKEDLSAHKATITALCMNNRLDERLEEEITWARKVVGAAQALRVDAIRIDVVPRKIPADQFLPFAIKACKHLCEVVKDTPIRFAIENHGGWTNNPKYLGDLFDGVGSGHLGLTLDAMNFYWFGHPLQDVYKICQQFASRVFHTHCKNLRYPEEKRNVRRPMGWEYGKYAAPVYEGDIDYPRIAKILRQAGYRGDLCLENECLGRFPREEHAEILRKELNLLKSLA